MRRFFILAAISGIFILNSCDSNTTERVEEELDTLADKIEGATDSLGNRIQKNTAEDDAEFVREVAKSNNMELHMLAEGRAKGTNKELRDAARQMETDHKKLAQDLKDYAAKKNITLDTTMDHSMNNEAKGADWDKKWVNDMVDDHEQEIRKFEKEENEVEDQELKSLITNTLPVLRKHLDMSKELQTKLNK